MSSTAKPIDWGKYTKSDGEKTVTAIYMVGIPTFPKSTNPANAAQHLVHWRVHLRWAGKHGLAQASVVLDTYKSKADPIVTIDIYSKLSLVSNKASKNWSLPIQVIKANLKVQEVLDLITANGRERYKYDGNGSGCLSWCTKLLDDYVAAGYVDSQATKRFAEFIKATRESEPAYWIPDDKGTYI